MIKAIIFDCFGVLTTDLWKAFLAELTDETAIAKARELNRAYDAGLLDLDEFMNGVTEATGHRPNRVEELLENKGEIVKNTTLLDYIQNLRGRGYKIGLLSNIATNWIRDIFLSEQEQALFDGMVMSFEAGTVKPDPRIFELACERLDVEPAEAIMIDDIDSYCEAAKGIGMQAVVYRDFKQAVAEIENILK